MKQKQKKLHRLLALSSVPLVSNRFIQFYTVNVNAVDNLFTLWNFTLLVSKNFLFKFFFFFLKSAHIWLCWLRADSSRKTENRKELSLFPLTFNIILIVQKICDAIPWTQASQVQSARVSHYKQRRRWIDKKLWVMAPGFEANLTRLGTAWCRIMHPALSKHLHASFSWSHKGNLSKNPFS